MNAFCERLKTDLELTKEKLIAEIFKQIEEKLSS
jgi:hypothetical protein